MKFRTPPDILQQLGLSKFVCLDLETTGFRPEDSEIIEVGAVRVEAGAVIDRYQTLVAAEGPVPEAITYLTGISSSDLENQPALDKVFRELRSFIGDDVIVAHNIRFDLGFMQETMDRIAQPSLSMDLSFARHADMLLLSRILLPRIRSHSLEFLADLFEIQQDTRHRALEDALIEIEVLDRLLLYSIELPDQTLAQLMAVTRNQFGFMSGLFRGIQAVRSGSGFSQIMAGLPPTGIRPRKYRSNILSRRKQKPDHPDDFDPDQVVEVLHRGGALDRGLTNYEHRDEQIEMAREICYAYENRSFLMVEAGTGTGKSWAYLVPAIFWSQAHMQPGNRTIISTNTKNLQDQIFHKDLPFLHEHLDTDFQAVVLKGRHNYLCIHRWLRFLANIDPDRDSKLIQDILPLIVWANETDTGDIDECTSFNQNRLSYVWWQIRSDGNVCKGMACPAKERCFLNRIRRAAREADLVIVNHALLLSDLVSNMSVLMDYENLVIDEAHNLEEVATRHFGFQWSSRTVPQVLSFLVPGSSDDRNEIRILSELLTRKSGLDHADIQMSLSSLERVRESVEELLRANEAFFRQLQQVFSNRHLQPNSHAIEIRYKNWFENHPALEKPSRNLLSALGHLLGDIKILFDNLGEISQSGFDSKSGELFDESLAAIQAAWDLLTDLQNHLRNSLSDHTSEQVYWLEISLRKDGVEHIFNSAPIEPGAILNDKLYCRLKTAVFTSATLNIAKSFSFFEGRLGIDLLPDSRRCNRTLGSPFDHEKQIKVIIPSFLTDPRKAPFLNECAELIGGVILNTRLGTLVLFTSYQMLNQVYDRVSDELSANQLVTIAQGKSGSRENLLRMFREGKARVLFGTQSFWEGIDVPGEALELLIITKIPFDVPSHPVTAARSERIEAEGRNSFMEYAVPNAVLRFRQGFGRLIRSKNDRGVVLLMDSRILNSRYGEVFLNSIPVDPDIIDEPGQVSKNISDWFDREVSVNWKDGI